MSDKKIVNDIVDNLLSYKNYTPYIFERLMIFIGLGNEIIFNNSICYDDFHSCDYWRDEFRKAGLEQEWSAYRFDVVQKASKYWNELFTFLKTSNAPLLINADMKAVPLMEDLDARYNPEKR